MKQFIVKEIPKTNLETSNFGTRKTKNRVNELTANNEIAKSNKFIPETKIIASQTDIINNVCPKSG